MDEIEYSIILPVYNEQSTLNNMYAELTKNMTAISNSYEVIFVNDSSSDSSLEILKDLNRKDKHVKIINMSRRFGHQASLSAGIDLARGKAVIMMDSDLQHPPEMIGKLIDKWKEGYEIVYTVRKDTENIGFFDKITSLLFYKISNILTETKLPYGAADFRLIDSKVADALKNIKEKHRFMRGLISWVGFRQIGVEYIAKPRMAGESKYTLKKRLRFASEGITSFSSIPLKISLYIGFIVAFGSFTYGIIILYLKIFTNMIIETGWTSLILTLLFMGGIQLIALGIIGEYISLIYDEARSRPLYLIKELIGF